MLNIENKWYSDIRDGQLIKSADYVKKKYDDGNTHIINIVVFVDYEKLHEQKKDYCTEHDYNYLTIEDLKDYAGICDGQVTGNHMFDEYWFRF